jgi:hypothetical protein
LCYRCENRSFILREKHGFRVFENKMLRRKCGYKEEVGRTGEWGKF